MSKEAKIFFWIAVACTIVGVVSEGRMRAYKETASKDKREILELILKLNSNVIALDKHFKEHWHPGMYGKIEL